MKNVISLNRSRSHVSMDELFIPIIGSNIIKKYLKQLKIYLFSLDCQDEKPFFLRWLKLKVLMIPKILVVLKFIEFKR